MQLTELNIKQNYNEFIAFYHSCQIAGNSFEEAIDAETSGNLHDAYKAIYYMATDHYGYYAQKLNDALRGIGTDDAALIRHVVGRSEVTKLTFC